MKLIDSLTQTTKLCGPACATVKPIVKASPGTQVADFFGNIFGTANWPARWHCGSWSDFHGWLYIISDIGIWASYFAIPFLLVVMLRKKQDIPFHRIIFLFVAFILLCGLTHLIDAAIFWWPAYRLSALLRFITAVVSIFTVYALYRILPTVFNLRTVADLEAEIEKRRMVEEKLTLNEIALNRSLELTTQNNRQLKSFTHILSHNIRNHASNMALVSGLVDTEKLDAATAELFEKLNNVSRALNNTLEDLSHAIKIKEGVIKSTTINFADVTTEVLHIFESDLKVNNATLETDFAVEQVVFPHIYLESILINLISNAIKYRGADGNLKIVLKTYINNELRTVLECSDNGLGIDLKLHGHKLFGLYKTFHDRKDAHGVGLFLVKTQIESQGGQIQAQSTPGNGATFKIIF
ncbi:sensor histidine kinase [Mucilaginibacter gilvus]|uniref:histidine kinase n=1 Tax=Mucilaginibacter gilvus TaxID=2305909 RepID=A0A444MID9_9SPHI|nr:HAMP domain-containing sensor histidine kinase [Mucilaginibacter gilvus]RWY47863.1 HAMP domain-containing histidine kinase [Mucilaginibacter gilvus]